MLFAAPISLHLSQDKSMSLSVDKAKAYIPAGTPCKEAAKLAIPTDRKARHAFKRECKQAWKAQRIRAPSNNQPNRDCKEREREPIWYPLRLESCGGGAMSTATIKSGDRPGARRNTERASVKDRPSRRRLRPGPAPAAA